MNELKPEDVMRALECCVIQCAECRKCPMLYRKDNRGTCYTELKRLAIALLREKDAKIAELQSIAEFQQSSNMKRWFELQEKDKQIAEKDAKIERLSHHCSDCAGCTQWKCDCANIRDEAITEYIEKAKRRLPIISPSVFDQIAKEMKGENSNEH